MINRPNGILTFTTNGIPHIEIERKFNEWLNKEIKKAFNEGQKSAINKLKSKRNNKLLKE